MKANKEKEEKESMSIIELGRYKEVAVFVQSSQRHDVDLSDLSTHIKTKIKEYQKKSKLTIMDFEEGIKPKRFELPEEEYRKLISLQNSIIKHRSIDNTKFLGYLLQSLTIPELKAVCKDHELKGYSSFKKQELIQYIKDNLSREDQQYFLLENEKRIILREFKEALKIIYHKSPERIVKKEIVNPSTKELELRCQKKIGENTWNTTAYLSMTNIDDPERDCDCRVGAEMGLCPHFWVIFIHACAEGVINFKEWRLSYFPNAPTIRRLRDEILQGI